MISGRKKTCAPFFDRSNPDFDLYLHVQTFSLEINSYFLQRDQVSYMEPWEKPVFDIEYFYDVICAPYFFLETEGDCYPQELINLFYELFPTGEHFENALNNQVGNVLKAYKKETHDKDHLISHIELHAKKVNSFKDKIAALGKEKIDPWIVTSLNVIDKLLEELNHLKSLSNLILKEVLKYNYYCHNPDISWHGNPWGFFINMNYADGYNLLKHDWEISLQYSQEGTFEEYVADQMNRQAISTSNIILEKLKERACIKQRIITEACKQFVTFYRLGEDKNFSKEYLLAYILIIRQIQKHHSKKKYSLGGIKIEEVFFKRISDRDILNEMLRKSTQIQNYPTLNPLFGTTVNPDILLYLMLGQYDKFETVEFNTENGAPVYYFLLVCKYNEGAHFEIHKLINLNKIKVGSNYLSRSSFDAYNSEYGIHISKLKKGVKLEIPISKRQPYHNYIDFLFS